MAVRGEAAGAPARRALGTAGLGARLAEALARDAEHDAARLALWWPVLFACGIGGYFALPFEPGWTAVAAPLAACAALALLARRGQGLLSIAAAGALAAALGLAAAKARTEMVAGPVLERPIGAPMLAGRIESLDLRGQNRLVMVLAVETVEGLAPAATPRRARISVSHSAAGELAACMTVGLRAVLLPPPEPVAPGAYDPARRAWFAGIGAVGYGVSRLRTAPRPVAEGLAGWAAAARAAMERVRWRVAARVREVVPGEAGAVAAALLTGLRGAISEVTLNAMRDSGLAHLLAISGLHMALVCGAIFWAARAGLALVPPLALRLDPKKWAAAAALLAGLGYFLLAGGSVATERAFIMVAISLGAILVDRPAVTMRNLAVAAGLTLALRPESLLEAGFQMSYGAVVALVAFYDWVRARRAAARWAVGGEGERGLAAQIALALVAVAATTLVASLATGPFAAYHFNRIAAFGLAANLAAVPLVGVVVMPFGLVALAAMPFGLDELPLRLMTAGTAYVLEVAQTVAAWSPPLLVAAMPAAVPVLFVAGGLWLCLWQAAWRWLAVVPFTGAIVAGLLAQPPDILVDRDGENAAVRGSDGRLHLADPRAADYVVRQWLRRDGDGRAPEAAAEGLFACDDLGCLASPAGGPSIAFVRRRAALAEDCWRANIVVAQMPVRGPCPAPARLIDLFDLLDKGAHAGWIGADGTVAWQTNAEARGARPWVGDGR